MPRRIIIYPGFHKTGTSTVQRFLRTNRAALKGQVAIRLKPQMTELVAAARGYSTWRDPLTLDKAHRRYASLLEGLPRMPRRTLVLCAEELSGHMPGRGDIVDYSAAQTLLYGFVTTARQIFPQAEIAIYFTTRDRDEWVESAYWEHVKSSRMTLDLAGYQARYGQAASLDDMVDLIAATVPCPVHRAALGDCAALPLGPAGPLLDLCDLPQAVRNGLQAVPAANARLGPEILQALLAANRGYRDKDARRQAKAAILAKAGHT